MSQTLHAPRTSVPPFSRTSRVSIHAAGVRLFAAYWGSLALVDLTRQAPAVAVTVLVVWAAACSIGQRCLVAAAVGAITWCFLTGFVVNTNGDLTVHTTLDLAWLVLLSTTALVAAGLSRVVRR